VAALDAKGLGEILRGIGAPITAANIATLVGWERAEGGNASFNPFNTTLSEPGATSYNSVGVRNYVSEAQGIRATVDTLKSSYYANVVAELRKGNDPAGVARAVGASPWGTPDFEADIPNVHTIGGVEKLAASIPGATTSSSPFHVGLTPLGSSVVGAIKHPLSGLDAIGAFFGKLADPNVWLNAGFVLLGLVLLLVAIARLFSPALERGLAAGQARQAADLAVAA